MSTRPNEETTMNETIGTDVTIETPETIGQHWERRSVTDFDPDMHLADVRKGDRIAFPGTNGVTVHGYAASLTSDGYNVGVSVPGIPDDMIWVEVHAENVTPAPTDAPPADAPDLFQLLANDYERNVARIVRDLRDMADRLERSSTPAPNQKNPGFGNAASIVVADLMSMVPNFGLSGLVRSAAAADVALLSERAKMPL